MCVCARACGSVKRCSHVPGTRTRNIGYTSLYYLQQLYRAHQYSCFVFTISPSQAWFQYSLTDVAAAAVFSQKSCHAQPRLAPDDGCFARCLLRLCRWELWQKPRAHPSCVQKFANLVSTTAGGFRGCGGRRGSILMRKACICLAGGSEMDGRAFVKCLKDSGPGAGLGC